MKVELSEVWRDRPALDDIKAEMMRQKLSGWQPWELLLPPDMLWPMLEEVSQGMVQQWSPVLLGVGVQVGAQNEISIRFVRTEEKTSPVMVRTLPYTPAKRDSIVPVEVRRGDTIRV